MRNTYLGSEMGWFKYTTLILNNKQAYEKVEQIIKRINSIYKVSLMTVKKGILYVVKHDKLMNGQKDE
jgi:hypothetical protein